MERESADKLLARAKKIAETETSTVYRTFDGRVYKHFSSLSLLIDHSFDLHLADKVDFADKIVDFDELYKPTSAVYKSGHFCGLTTKFNDGVNFNEYFRMITEQQRNNLYFYKQLFEKLTRLVKKAHDKGIVIPDLCSCDNIYVDKEGNLSLIDYDGMQVDKYPVYGMSSSLGEQAKYFIPKYYDEKTALFTPELDKTSLMILYFLSALKVDFSKVGAVNPDTGKKVDFDFIFEFINLHDPIICSVIVETLSTEGKGHYLDTILGMIADKYTIEPNPQYNESKILVPR